MSVLLLTRKTEKQQKMYEAALYWLIRERGGGGGWPPRDINKVSGWITIRMIADLCGRTPREVAADLIEQSMLIGR
jgi:hypothetical protein